jgi:pimeloyl-ACP methyl ester carboxylesterase
LGTNLHVYDALASDLVKEGFTVLRYEYFNHGFSKSDDPFLVMDENVMVSQVEDLFSHTLEDGEPVSYFVGHSTGGVVAIQGEKGGH